MVESRALALLGHAVMSGRPGDKRRATRRLHGLGLVLVDEARAVAEADQDVRGTAARRRDRDRVRGTGRFAVPRAGAELRLLARRLEREPAARAHPRADRTDVLRLALDLH